MAKALKGILPPVATPFKDDEPDLRALKFNLSRLNQTGLSGYVVLGTNGEACYLSEKEKEAVFAAAGEVIPPDKIYMVGTGVESTRGTVELTKMAARHGAEYALLLTPSYYKTQMTPERWLSHFHKVADASPIPILIYNIPGNTGLNVSAELAARLAEHKNIAGLKDSSGNLLQLSEMVRLVPPEFTVFMGASPLLYPALTLGAKGGILAVANVRPKVCLKIMAAFEAGDLQTALKLHRLLTPLAIMVTSGWGVGGLKLAMNLAGYQGGGVRSPLADLTEDKYVKAIQAELDKLAPFEN